ncbi:MAG TPA: hypothetical protein VEP47_14665 [Reyranella sp.]|nr:hypothetical protein [Reyranella sp.]
MSTAMPSAACAIAGTGRQKSDAAIKARRVTPGFNSAPRNW